MEVNNLRDLINQLRQSINDRTTGTQMGQLRIRIARLVIDALENDLHPFRERVESLREVVGPEQVPVRAWFASNPGTTGEWTRVWRTQLLLLICALDNRSRRDLAVHLGLSEPQIQSAANEAWDRTAGSWHSNLLGQRLLACLDLLEFESRWQLENNVLRAPNGLTTSLRSTQLTLATMLFEAPNHEASHIKLGEEGVSDPTNTLSRLQKKLDEEGLPRLPVVNQDGFMRLTI